MSSSFVDRLRDLVEQGRGMKFLLERDIDEDGNSVVESDVYDDLKDEIKQFKEFRRQLKFLLEDMEAAE